MEIKSFCNKFDIYRKNYENIHKLLPYEQKLSIYIMKTYENSVEYLYSDNYYDIYSSLDILISRKSDFIINPYIIEKYNNIHDKKCNKNYFVIIEKNIKQKKQCWLVNKVEWNNLYEDRLKIKDKYWHPFDITLLK